MKSKTRISQKPDKIVITINEEAEIAEIEKELEKKVKDLKKLYKEEKTPIFVTGKTLKNKEMEKIKEIIQSNIDVKIEFESPTTLGLHGIKKTFEREIKNSDTKFFKGSLRSGKKLEYEGSIVILGDVNGGAEVVSGDNIVILGDLRGLAHAGAKGNKKAIIAANSIETPQLRIANIVKEIEREEVYDKHRYAYVEENNIILE